MTQQTRIVMGMPIAITITDAVDAAIFEKIFSYFTYVDEKFSTYKTTSEITRINNSELPEKDWSDDMRTVLRLCEETKKETNGYFDIVTASGAMDPSGLVKGWSIYNAAELLQKEGINNFFVDAGGDIEPRGMNAEGKPWRIGIKNPFNPKEIVKVLEVSDHGIATSGTYLRGPHIYNPKDKYRAASELVSLTVIGPNVYEADRFATPAFAMGKRGISFLEALPGFEAYGIDGNGIATMTGGFEKYIIQ